MSKIFINKIEQKSQKEIIDTKKVMIVVIGEEKEKRKKKFIIHLIFLK